ncbi:MAG: hypothetical protein WCO60_11440 [Verrucomicrobiota bacterium]
MDPDDELRRLFVLTSAPQFIIPAVVRCLYNQYKRWVKKSNALLARGLILSCLQACSLFTANAQTTSGEWQAEVTKKYPVIGQAGSDLNKKYILTVTETRKTNPDLFKAEDWPMVIAVKLVNSLGESLRGALHSNDIAKIIKESTEFQSDDKADWLNIQELGRTLKKAQDNLANVASRKPAVDAELKTFRNNAKVASTPSVLNRNITSGEQKAQEWLTKADTLETNYANLLSNAKEQQEAALSALRSAVSRPPSNQVKVAGATPVKEMQPPPKNVVDEEKTVSIASLKESDLPPVRYHNFSMSNRGPLIHGFQLGMSLTFFFETIKKHYPDALVQNLSGFYQRVQIGGLVNEPDLQVYPTAILMNDEKQRTIAHVVAIGSPPVVVSYSLYLPLLLKFFKLQGISFNEFCQSMIDGYSIPSVRGNDLEKVFKSPEGWHVSLNQDGGLCVRLTAVPMESERGFGK